MKVEIFDVQHGFCALVTTPGQNTILMDCGSSAGQSLLTYWQPGWMLASRGIRTVDELIVSHADDDHLRGFPSLNRYNVNVHWVSTNPDLSPQTIRSLKPEAPREPVEQFLRHLHRQRQSSNPRSLFIPMGPPEHDITVDKYWVRHSPGSSIQDLNNLSLVTFISYQGLRIIFPGDIEEPAWRILLGSHEFKQRLQTVNVFVAPHHGRKNGYFGEVFRYCSPDLVVFSDKAVQHDTQETASLYGQHTRGVNFGNQRTKRVLTTRNNGTITFASQPRGFNVQVTKA